MGVPSFPVIRPGGEPLPEELRGVAALAAAATTGFVVRTGEATYAARPAAIADIEGLSDVLDAFASLPDPEGQDGLYLTVAGDQYVLGVGTPGEPGEDGADGLSAYQLAVLAGYEGTVSEWLASLKGDQGDPGPGLPPGGATGQIPAKASGDDYDLEWIDAAPGGGSSPGGTEGQIQYHAPGGELGGFGSYDPATGIFTLAHPSGLVEPLRIKPNPTGGEPAWTFAVGGYERVGIRSNGLLQLPLGLGLGDDGSFVLGENAYTIQRGGSGQRLKLGVDVESAGLFDLNANGLSTVRGIVRIHGATPESPQLVLPTQVGQTGLPVQVLSPDGSTILCGFSPDGKVYGDGSELTNLPGGGGTGPPGPEGDSAYQVALDNGFEGTESEWLASLKGEPGDPGPNEITTATDTPLVGALAGADGKVRAALAEDLPTHSHAGLSITIASGSLWGGDGTGTPTAVPLGTGTAASVLRRSDGDARYAAAVHTHTFTEQVQVSRHSDSSFHYPYLNLRVSAGTAASPADVSAGRSAGAVNSYAYLDGSYQFLAAVLTHVVSTAGGAVKGRIRLAVNDGSGPNASVEVASADSTGITLARDTAVQGSLSVTGTISGDGSGLTGVAKPADLAALARPVPYSWGGSSPTVAVKSKARVRVPHAGTAVQVEASCDGARTGDCTLRVLRSTDGGTTFGATVGEITLSDSQDHDYTSLSVALIAGDYLCPEVVEVGGASSWSLRLTVLSEGA